MLIHQPSLADQTAALRTAILAEDAPCWLPDAVHALIMACLARIFGRLEDMIRLWQAGILPPPSPVRPRAIPSRPVSLAFFRGPSPLAPRHSGRAPCTPFLAPAHPAPASAASTCNPTRARTKQGFVLPCLASPCLCASVLNLLLAVFRACRPARAPPPQKSAIPGHYLRTP